MAFNDPEIERLAKRDREWLEQKRPQYEKAKAWIAQNGGADRDWLLNELIAQIGAYSIKDPPHVAVYLLGQMKQAIADANFHSNFIAQYEGKMKQMADRAAADRERTGEDPSGE